MTLIEKKKLIILALVAAVLILAMTIILVDNVFVRYRTDFFARWYASEKLFSEGRNLYDDRNGSEVILYSKFPDPLQAGFYYPAYMIALTGPLALMPYGIAVFIWYVLIQSFYLVGLWLMSWRVDWPDTVNQKTIFLGVSFLFLPYLQHTIWGQFDTIAVISLALVYLSLRSERYTLAGVFSVGLIFKPQDALLALFFLLLWSLFRKERIGFAVGFAGAAALLWIITELLQPGWFGAFLGSIDDYVPTQSILTRIWNPHQLTAIGLVLITVFVAFLHRNASPNSTAFSGTLALSIGVWFLVVPIHGMLHLVLFPLALLLLMKSLAIDHRNLYRYALFSFLILYIAGWIGFIGGLLFPGLYGKHIEWSELAYKTVAPLVLCFFSILLFLREESKKLSNQKIASVSN